MKRNKLSFSMKFLLISILAVVISTAAFGLTKIFAEPTIEELVTEDMIQNMGTFEPNGLYDDEYTKDLNENGDGLQFVGMLNITDLIFSYDYWQDYDGDGTIDLECDIYDREGYETNMFMFHHLVSMFQVKEEDDYYIVPLTDYKLYNGVVIDVLLGNNNDKAELKDSNMYWFDQENYLLYIDQTLIQDDIESEFFNSLRAQIVMLTKETKTLTKDIDIITLFDAEIEDLKGLYDNTPSDNFSMSVDDWESYGFQYQLIKEEDLALITSNSLTVYVNDIELEPEEWSYDELTGYMTIDCPVVQTRTVVVKINEIQDISLTQQVLQTLQNAANDNVGQAATLEETLKDSYILGGLTYDTEPQLAATEKIEFSAYVNYENNDFIVAPASKHYVGSISIPTSQIKDAFSSYANKATKVNGWLQAATISAWKHVKGGTESTYVYGQVLYNIYQAAKQGKTSALDAALSTIEGTFCDRGILTGGYDYNKWLSSVWRVDKEQALYVNGKVSSKTLLGGTIDSGYAMFETTCATINAPSYAAYKEISSDATYKSGFAGNMTIIKKTQDSTGSSKGHLIIAIWSDYISNYGSTRETQRLLGFSKVPYTYKGAGKIQIKKIDSSTGEAIADATYTIYKTDGVTVVDTIRTTADGYATSKDIVAGKYYIKETSCPTGYLMDSELKEITIVAGETIKKTLEDDPQMCEFEFTVYDKTTKGNSVEVPVDGINFNLVSPDGTVYRSYTTGYDVNGNKSTSGTISDTIPAKGIYTLVQDGTVENYAMDTDEHSVDYCNIQIDATPTKSGTNIKYTGTNKLKHYENRQTVTIKSQVQDSELLEATPAVLGGDNDNSVFGKDIVSSSYVALIGARYQLRTKSEILLGYTNSGTPVIVDKNTVLTVKTRNKAGLEAWSRDAYSYQADGKAFIEACGVRYNGVDYILPNGEYQWELIDTSSGYYNDEAKIKIDAEWDVKNQKKIEWTMEKTPVVQERQTVDITLFVKSYTANDKTTVTTGMSSGGYVFRNNVFARLKTKLEALLDTSEKSNVEKSIEETYTKTIITDGDGITLESTETATLYQENEELIKVKTSALVPNAIYELTNLNTIVDTKTGKEIAARTLLGRYVTDENGNVYINELGSESFLNPNEETKDSFERIGEVNPKTVDSTIATGALPNGVYALTVVVTPDNYRGELGLEEDIVFETGWSLDNSKTKHIETQTETFFRYYPLDNYTKNTIVVAPDVPVQDPNEATDNNPYDPYDPNNPDDPLNPDDSNDITIVDTDWIDKNEKNKSYRIVDSENITGSGTAANYDVSDNLPATFAFYIKDPNIYDEIYDYVYKLSFYYEIDKTEYESAPASAKSNNEYIIVDNYYYRRFQSSSLSGGDALQDVLVLNQTSPGYESYTNMKDKQLTVSGAIYNTTWLNEKLAQQEDGEFRICIFIDTEIHYKTKTSEDEIVQYIKSRIYGTLIMKNRELVKLD